MRTSDKTKPTAQSRWKSKLCVMRRRRVISLGDYLGDAYSSQALATARAIPAAGLLSRMLRLSSSRPATFRMSLLGRVGGTRRQVKGVGFVKNNTDKIGGAETYGTILGNFVGQYCIRIQNVIILLV